MMMLRRLVWSCHFAIALFAGAGPGDLVDPLIGTAHDGQTFPGVGVPFGMTQWTPQTQDGEAKCVAPYYFKDDRIQGFRGTHSWSGSCTQDYGSVTIMPQTGPLKTGKPWRALRDFITIVNTPNPGSTKRSRWRTSGFTPN